MITRKQIEAIALDHAFSLVFSNVGEDDWPEDAMAWMRNGEDDGKEMIPWQPFEDFNVDRLYDTVLDFRNSCAHAIYAALVIDRG